MYLFIYFAFECSIIVYIKRKINARCTKDFRLRKWHAEVYAIDKVKIPKNVEICDGVLQPKGRGEWDRAKCSQSRTPRDSHPLSLLSDVTRYSKFALHGLYYLNSRPAARSQHWRLVKFLSTKTKIFAFVSLKDRYTMFLMYSGIFFFNVISILIRYMQ